MTDNFQLIAAPHAPFADDFAVNLDVVEKQFLHLQASDVSGAFVNGTTGESFSLTLPERMQIAARWSEVRSGTGFRVIVHVGHNTQADAIELARHASSLDIEAIAAFAPSFFRPGSVSDLINFMAPIAEAAQKPFYYYDIPGYTNVHLPAAELISRAIEIPNFAGIKFSNPNLLELQDCLDVAAGKFEILFGCDEVLLATLPLGVHGAVGSTYNFCAGLYREMITAFESGNHQRAKQLQLKSVRIVEAIAQFGFLAASKQTMKYLGIDCGQARPPLSNLSPDQLNQLRTGLTKIGLLESLQ